MHKLGSLQIRGQAINVNHEPAEPRRAIVKGNYSRYYTADSAIGFLYQIYSICWGVDADPVGFGG